MRIYLAGPINGCTDAQATGWREQAKALLEGHDLLDPMSRDYRGIEAENVAAIVESDKEDIDQSDVLLMYFERPSVGTSMEVLYAWERFKIIIVVDVSERPLSPWLQYHATRVLSSLKDVPACLTTL